jgi:hypothetical protein
LQELNFHKLAEVAEAGEDSQIRSIALGSLGEVILQTTIPMGLPRTRQEEESAGVGRQLDWRYFLLRSAKDEMRELALRSSQYFIVQPLESGRLLCVKSCCRHGENNAFIREAHGDIVDAFRLGDAIEDVQVAGDGKIWVSYFDEGVFGSGLGQAGLACFSRDGEVEFRFNHSAMALDLPTIDDCYAMNVAGDGETYAYYYSDFPLVRIKDKQITKVCEVPIHGSHAFAVHEDWALFSGAYDKRGIFFLVNLSGREVTEFQPKDEEGRIIQIDCAVGRDSRLYAASGRTLYAIDLSELVI